MLLRWLELHFSLLLLGRYFLFSAQRQWRRNRWVAITWRSVRRRTGELRESGREWRKEPGVSALGSLGNAKDELTQPLSLSATFAKSCQNGHWINLVLRSKEHFHCLVEYDPDLHWNKLYSLLLLPVSAPPLSVSRSSPLLRGFAGMDPFTESTRIVIYAADKMLAFSSNYSQMYKCWLNTN